MLYKFIQHEYNLTNCIAFSLIKKVCELNYNVRDAINVNKVNT